MNPRRRDVRRSTRFDVDAAQIDADVKRMDDAVRYVEDVLARTPEAGLRTKTPGIWVAPIIFWHPTTSGFAAASIFYAFDEEIVDLISVLGDW